MSIGLSPDELPAISGTFSGIQDSLGYIRVHQSNDHRFLPVNSKVPLKKGRLGEWSLGDNSSDWLLINSWEHYYLNLLQSMCIYLNPNKLYMYI